MPHDGGSGCSSEKRCCVFNVKSKQPRDSPTRTLWLPLTRKNALFAGHEAGAENWAMIASLIETCKLNAVDPHAWLSDTFKAIAGGHRQSDIDALLPWNYKGSWQREGGHEHRRDQGHA